MLKWDAKTSFSPPSVPSPTLPCIPVGLVNRPTPVPRASTPSPTLKYGSGEFVWTSLSQRKLAALCSTFQPLLKSAADNCTPRTPATNQQIPSRGMAQKAQC